MKKSIALAQKIANQLEKHLPDVTPQGSVRNLDNGDDATLGVVIPASKVKVVRDDVAKTYKLLSEGPLAQIAELLGAIPELKKAQNKMIELTNLVDGMSLIELARAVGIVYDYLWELRDDMKGKIRDIRISKKVDEILKRIQDRLYKVHKSIRSLPQLKGTPMYTWNYGAGRNPTPEIQQQKKTFEQEQRRKIMDPTAEEIWEEAWKKYEAKKNPAPPTFQQFENSGVKNDTMPTEQDPIMTIGE